MKAMVTSFGIDGLSRAPANTDSLFYRMPPVSHRNVSDTFVPDYELLLLFDSIVMDEESFERLVRSSVPAYSLVSETFQALHSDGRIELKPFSTILDQHRVLLRRMLRRDLKWLEQWVQPFRESVGVWQRFAAMSIGLLPRGRAFESRRHFHQESKPRFLIEDEGRAIFESMGLHVARSGEVFELSTTIAGAFDPDSLEFGTWRGRRQASHGFRVALRDYLAYVNANLVLSEHLGVAFHDWLDMAPFYATKFLSIGRDENAVEAHRVQVEKLFTVAFPELAITDTRAFMKALHDKRLSDLRGLVADAVAGRVEFDAEFARSVLSEAFRDVQRSQRLRKIAGYATLPIDLVPWVGAIAQKAVEEMAGNVIDRVHQRKHRWFYMLSQLAR